MCRAHTHVFYGLPVRAWTLVDAATAWPRLKPVLPFFSLVELRLKNGSLRTDTPSAIERIPLEVWEIVKEELVRVEIASTSLAATAFEHACTFDGDCLFRQNLKCSQKQDWEALSPANMCESCDEGLDNFVLLADGSEWSSLVHSMVTAFGLAIASLLWVRPSDADYVDPASAFYLCVSPSAALEADCGGQSGPDELSIATPTSDVPRNAKTRFLRLIRLLQLDPVSVTGLTPNPPAEPTPRRMLRNPDRRKIEGITLAEVEPRWVVLTQCESNW
ncbi:uncharacterized protein JCM10292_002301 [Rhodotorula paludigena]|uniref:uncharacterized protein n=1 Tax=Rhodotorula paludigena TaxID=86838 RepID=UPI0031755B4C